jgi:hypothetical protein
MGDYWAGVLETCECDGCGLAQQKTPVSQVCGLQYFTMKGQ